MDQIKSSDFVIDMGVMYGVESKAEQNRHARVGYTALPKRCCSKSFVRSLEWPSEEDDDMPKLKATEYTWGLSRDVTAMTIVPPADHPYRERGFFYLQFYPGIKNIFECQAHYPYPSDDDSGIALAMDDHSLKAIYSANQRPVPRGDACRKSCRHSGQRIAIPLKSKPDQVRTSFVPFSVLH